MFEGEITHTVRHSGFSVMLWGCFAASRSGALKSKWNNEEEGLHSISSGKPKIIGQDFGAWVQGECSNGTMIPNRNKKKKWQRNYQIKLELRFWNGLPKVQTPERH